VACSLIYDDTLSRVRIDADSLCVTGVVDTYSRTVVSGWGSADTGQAWTVVPTAADYSVTGNVGHINVPVENVFYNASLNAGGANVDLTVSFSTNKLASGGPQAVEVAARWADVQNFYAARALLNTDQSVVFDVRKRVLNAQTVLNSTASPGVTHAASTFYKIRLQVIDDLVRAKIWLATNTEPSGWTVTANDTTLTSGSGVALRATVATGASNEPIQFNWDNLMTSGELSAIVDRTTDGVTYTTVRGASDVGLTTGCELERIVDDYEFPVDELITYRIRTVNEDGTVLATTTCQIEVDLDRVWLKSIGRPFLNQAIDCVLNPTPIIRRARNGVNPIVGRSYPVAVTDLRGSREVPLRVVTRTTTERQDLDLLLASGDPIFVHTPAGYPLPTMYAVIEDTAENRPVRNRLCDADWRLWDLPLIEVAAPGPDVVGSTSTWQTVVNTYATWADVLIAHPTWADLLELVGDGSEVIVP
jgi:hypothetical protein